MTKRAHIQIKSRKNGKNSRHLIAETANTLGLTGYASDNRGIVEIVVEGEGSSVWQLIKEFTSDKFEAKFREILFYFRDPKNEFTGFIVV